MLSSKLKISFLKDQKAMTVVSIKKSQLADRHVTSLVVCIDSSLVILKTQKLGLCSFIIGEWANSTLWSNFEGTIEKSN